MDLVSINFGLDFQLFLFTDKFCVLSFNSILDKVLVVELCFHFLILGSEIGQLFMSIFKVIFHCLEIFSM